MITSSERRRHYADVVGPSGIELLNKLSAYSKLADSKFAQTAHSRRLKAQIAETMKMKLTHVSLEEFDSIKDTLEDLNDQFDDAKDNSRCHRPREVSTAFLYSMASNLQA